jgi:hypothetical protein
MERIRQALQQHDENELALALKDLDSAAGHLRRILRRTDA